VTLSPQNTARIKSAQMRTVKVSAWKGDIRKKVGEMTGAFVFFSCEKRVE